MGKRKHTNKKPMPECKKNHLCKMRFKILVRGWTNSCDMYCIAKPIKKVVNQTKCWTKGERDGVQPKGVRELVQHKTEGEILIKKLFTILVDIPF